MKSKIIIQKCKCLRCNSEWIPRKEEIKFCPKCKSPYWDMERKPLSFEEAMKRMSESKMLDEEMLVVGAM